MNDNYIFFWGGPFSNFYPSKMVIDGTEFFCSEQFFMSKKALYFGDMQTYELIMQAKDPKTAKYLGRKVKNFVAKEWEKVSRDYMFDANYAKFSQNKILRDKLLNTNDKELVESSPFDCIWGIGLDAKKASITNKSDWPGLNWLGQTLMKVRAKLKEEINLEM